MVMASAQAVASSSNDAAGDGQGGEVGNHGLKIEECFEPPLGNFRLIWRVLCVPTGIFENIALDDGRNCAIVVTCADERAEHFIFGGNLFEFGERFKFTFCFPGRFKFLPRRICLGTAASAARASKFLDQTTRAFLWLRFRLGRYGNGEQKCRDVLNNPSEYSKKFSF